MTSPLQRNFASEAAPEEEDGAMEEYDLFGEEEDLEEVNLEDFSEEQWSSNIVHGRGLFEPIYHPRTHGIPAATVHFRSYHVSLLQMFSHFAAHSASALGIPISHPTPLPTQRSMWTVLKGPFVHKKSQENFDRKTHKRVIKAWDADPEVVERWVRYLEKHALAGVGMRVVRWERAPVGVGKKVADAVAAAMDAAKLQTPRGQVEALSGDIVKQELATGSGEITVKATVTTEAAAEQSKPAEASKPVEQTKVATESEVAVKTNVVEEPKPAAKPEVGEEAQTAEKPKASESS